MLKLIFSKNEGISSGIEEITNAVFECRSMLYFTLNVKNNSISDVKPYKETPVNKHLLLFRVNLKANRRL